MQSITVRQAVLADIEDLTGLFDQYRQFYGKGRDLAGARRFLLDRFERGESFLLLAHAQGQAVGFTQLYPSFSSLSMARVFVLNDLFVADTARRQGVASQLLGAATALASSVGAVALTLSTALDNRSAQALYEAAGWQRDTDFFTYNLRLAR